MMAGSYQFNTDGKAACNAVAPVDLLVLDGLVRGKVRAN